MDGIINIYKPAGVSSFKCLSIVKRRLWEQLPEPKHKFKNWRVGFLGTLDPLADGVLVLLCGSCTKMANKLHEGRKVYQSTFTFGIETTTLDEGGETVATSEILPTREQIIATLPRLHGDIEIEVPKFSAVHINGNRAYDLARAGVDFTPPTRVVNIARFELLQQISNKEFLFEIECNAGTYIRSLACLLAHRLDTLAIASTITRTRVGGFTMENSKNIDDVTLDDMKIIM